MPVSTQNVVDEIADIVRRVGKREEIEEAIVNDVDFSGLVADLLKEPGPVRDAATKLVLTHVKIMDLSEDEDITTAVLENLDIKKMLPQILSQIDVKEQVEAAIENLIENDEIDFAEVVGEAIDADALKKLVNKDEINKIISEKLQEWVEQTDLSDLDDVGATIDEIAFSKERIESSLKANAEEVDEIVFGKVKDYLESSDASEYEDHPIAIAVQESKAFTAAVEKAVNELVEAGKVDRLVEKVATAMLTDNNSELRERLVVSVSEQLVGKIATQFVDRTLGK